MRLACGVSLRRPPSAVQIPAPFDSQCAPSVATAPATGPTRVREGKAVSQTRPAGFSGLFRSCKAHPKTPANLICRSLCLFFPDLSRVSAVRRLRDRLRLTHTAALHPVLFVRAVVLAFRSVGGASPRRRGVGTRLVGRGSGPASAVPARPTFAEGGREATPFLSCPPALLLGRSRKAAGLAEERLLATEGAHRLRRIGAPFPRCPLGQRPRRGLRGLAPLRSAHKVPPLGLIAPSGLSASPPIVNLDV